MFHVRFFPQSPWSKWVRPSVWCQAAAMATTKCGAGPRGCSTRGFVLATGACLCSAEIDSLVNFKPLRWYPLSPLRTGPWFFCLAKSYGKAWQIFGKSTCRVHGRWPDMTGCTWDKSWEPLCLQFLDANIKCVASLFRQLGPEEVASVDKKYEWKPEFKNWPSSNCRNANSVAWSWWKFSVKNLVSADQAMQGQTAGCGSLCRCVCVWFGVSGLFYPFLQTKTGQRNSDQALRLYGLDASWDSKESLYGRHQHLTSKASCKTIVPIARAYCMQHTREHLQLGCLW